MQMSWLFETLYPLMGRGSVTAGELAGLETYEERLCVQIVHIRPYTTERASMEKLAAFIDENNLIDQCGTDRRHHEIYLSDPRKTAVGRLKTVLRHPGRRK